MLGRQTPVHINYIRQTNNVSDLQLGLLVSQTIKPLTLVLEKVRFEKDTFMAHIAC